MIVKSQIIIEVNVRILVINCGSSSAKFQLIETSDGKVLARGNVERIGFDDSIFTYKPENGNKMVEILPAKDHNCALNCILEYIFHEI